MDVRGRFWLIPIVLRSRKLLVCTKLSRLVLPIITILSLRLGPCLSAWSSTSPLARLTRRTMRALHHHSHSSFADFVASHRNQMSRHVCIGNEAGDADSIVSALALAYVDSLLGDSSSLAKTPVVSVSKADLRLRQEAMLLLEMAGLQPHHIDSLVYLDDLNPTVRQQQIDKVTLLDHNRMMLEDCEGWTVVEILDHHFDEDCHRDSATGARRNVAFDTTTDKALVGSTCTLITERMCETIAPPFRADLAFALLGVILLDTVNLLPEEGKVTARDQNAVAALQRDTDWTSLTTESAVKMLRTGDDGLAIDTDKLFQCLNDSKFDPNFWKQLTVFDALRLDYKQFKPVTSNTDKHPRQATSFGASSILQSIPEFLAKQNQCREMKEFMMSRRIPVLAVLSVSTTEGGRQRALLLCGTDEQRVDGLVAFLQSTDGGSSLQLVECELGVHVCQTLDCPITLRYFSQGNVKASRKQIAPILLDYYNQP